MENELLSTPKTATFTDLKLIAIPPTRKNGRTKYKSEDIIVEDTIHPLIIQFNGIRKILYIRGSKMDEQWKNLYNADGTPALGIWQHGRFGSKPHTEYLTVNSKNILVTRQSYASGQIKDQHKYLKSIL